jgi:hemerythrin-like domain-containing protein
MPTRTPPSNLRLENGGRIMPIVIGAKPESDFTDPVGMLGDCHRRIVRFLNVLVSLSKENGGPLSDEHRNLLATSLRYFREGAPKHTADEEESLFPRLRRLDVPGLEAVLARIDSLEQDHECAERSHVEVDRLGQLWLTNGRLSPEDASRLSTLLTQLTALYLHHIGTEDTQVFPFAASTLSSADRQAIGAEMAARRGISPTIESGVAAVR